MSKGKRKEVSLQTIKEKLLDVKKRLDYIPFSRYVNMSDTEKTKLQNVSKSIDETIKQIS